MMKTILNLAMALLLMSCDGIAVAQGTLPDLSRMNILFLCPEDWTTEAIGAYGNKEVLTPRLDELARQSTLFAKAYNQNPVCNPSRGAITTGLRTKTNKVYTNGEKFDQVIPGWATTIGETLQSHPIKTYMVGKLFHHNWEAVKQANAFDGIYGETPKAYKGRILKYDYPAGTPQNPSKDWVYTPDPEWDAKMVEAMKRREEIWAEAEKGSEQWHEGRKLFQDLSAEVVGDSGDIEERNPDGVKARVVVNLLREHGKNGEQFFITFGSSRPHTPLRAPQKYFDLYDSDTLSLTKAPEGLDQNIPPVAKRFGRNWDIFKIREPTEEAQRNAIHGYYACASFIDDQIGLILDTLEETGLATNTIVIFTTDHGFHLGEHGMWSKISLFEQSTRVPLIIRIPGVTKGDRTDAIVELVDLYPTLCDLLGIPLPHDKLEGISLLPVIENPQREWKKAAFTVCRQGEFLGNSVRTSTHRYTEWINFNDRENPDAPVRFKEFYDLVSDPWEQKNLAGMPEYMNKVDEMADLLHKGWEQALPAPVATRTKSKPL